MTKNGVLRTKNEKYFSVQKKMVKSLTDSTAVNIPYVLAISDYPLTSQQIINKMKELNLIKGDGKNVHDKLTKLLPYTSRLDKETLLFDWNKFPKNDKSYHDTSILKRLTDLIKREDREIWENNKWQISERSETGKYDINENIKIDPSQKEEKILTISYLHQKIIIDLNKKVFEFYIGSQRKFYYSLVTHKTPNNTLTIHLYRPSKYNTYYLKPSLNETFKRKYKMNYQQFREANDLLTRFIGSDYGLDFLSEFQKETIIKNQRMHEDLTNSRYWQYSLNSMGILLYLCAEQNQGKKINSARILNFISSKQIQSSVYYLKHWNFFVQVGFPFLDVIREIVNTFKSYILNSIKYSKRYLLLQRNNICLYQVDLFDQNFRHILLFNQSCSEVRKVYNNLNIQDKINEYKKTILKVNETLLRNELEEVESYKGQQLQVK